MRREVDVVWLAHQRYTPAPKRIAEHSADTYTTTTTTTTILLLAAARESEGRRATPPSRIHTFVVVVGRRDIYISDRSLSPLYTTVAVVVEVSRERREDLYSSTRYISIRAMRNQSSLGV